MILLMVPLMIRDLWCLYTLYGVSSQPCFVFIFVSRDILPIRVAEINWHCRRTSDCLFFADMVENTDVVVLPVPDIALQFINIRSYYRAYLTILASCFPCHMCGRVLRRVHFLFIKACASRHNPCSNIMRVTDPWTVGLFIAYV